MLNTTTNQTASKVKTTYLMLSKFNSKCIVCNYFIKVGSQICWQPGLGGWHVECAVPGNFNKEQNDKPETKTYNISTYDNFGMYNLSGFNVGDLVENLRSSILKGEPEFLVVIKCSSKEIKQQSTSNNRFPDRKFIYYATCKEADPRQVEWITNNGK